MVKPNASGTDIKKCQSINGTIIIVSIIISFLITSKKMFDISTVNSGMIFTFLHVIVGTIFVPYLILFNPELSETKWQIVIVLFILVLDWYSIYLRFNKG